MGVDSVVAKMNIRLRGKDYQEVGFSGLVLP